MPPTKNDEGKINGIAGEEKREDGGTVLEEISASSSR